MIPRITQQLQPKKERLTEKSDGTVWQEFVTGINGTLYQVRGAWVPGLVPVKVGDLVYVEYANNKPLRIIDFDVRRGSARATAATPTTGIVEQFFIAPSKDGGKQTVWFRNHDQITELRYEVLFGSLPPGRPIFADWTNTIEDVFWGINPDIFCVLEGGPGNERFHVYRLVRKENKNKILTSKAKVAEKLYTIVYDNVPFVDLITVTGHWKRDSVEPYALMEWHPANMGDPSPWVLDNAEIKRDTNVNIAEVSRTVTIRLTGTDITYVNGSPIPANDSIAPNAPGPRATAAIVPGGYMVNEANDLIVSVEVKFVDWGLWQGNSAVGLTGSHMLKGDGTPIGVGICPFLTFCPHLVDEVGMQDFMDHGNPSGVISNHITETHAVLMNAKTGTMVSSTFASTVTLEAEETTNGAHPYRIEHDTGMPAAPGNEWCYQAADQPGPGGWRTGVAESVPVNHQVAFGSVGDIGLKRNDRSLFNQALLFSPDLPQGLDPTPSTPTRGAVIRVVVNTEGYDQEWTDGFGSHCGPFSGHFPTAARATWSANSIGVFDRYQVHVSARPFYSEGGIPVSFVSVIRTAKKPVGFTSDQTQLGAFVVSGNSAVTLLPYENVPGDTVTAPVFVSGNSKHVIWKRQGRWYISDYRAGTTKEVGGEPSKTNTLQLTLPDFLYSYDEKKRYFVNGWNRATGALTLTDTGDKFPPKDQRIATLGTLKDLTEATSGADKKDNHTILDTALVPKAYRT